MLLFYFIQLAWSFFFFFCKIFFRQVDVACQCQKQFGKSCSRLEAQIKAAMGVGLLQHWKGYYRMFWISVYKIFYFILFPHLFHLLLFWFDIFLLIFFPSFFALIFFYFVSQVTVYKLMLKDKAFPLEQGTWDGDIPVILPNLDNQVKIFLHMFSYYLNISACVFVFFCVCFYIIWIFLHMFLDFLYLDMFIYFCVHVYIFLCTCLCISSYVWFKVR